MKDKVEQDLRNLYENYANVLIQKENLEVEIRIRQGILNLLAAEQEKAKQAEAENG